MKTSGTTFFTIYTDWLNTILSLLPGGAGKAPEPTPKQEQAAAHQEWEDEGGCIKPPEKKPEHAPEVKIPF